MFTFLFSYYVIVQSWSLTVWEFYTIPFGLAMVGVGYYLQIRQKQYRIHNDIILVGLLFILLPTLVQSYQSWFAHLRVQVSPYRHLYHSIFSFGRVFINLALWYLLSTYGICADRFCLSVIRCGPC